MDSDIITNFRRKETKYLLTDSQMDLMLDAISFCFTENEFGRSRVSSVYYDSDSYELIGRSAEKPLYKEKLRVRTYSSPVPEETQVFAEIKKKYDGIVYKRRVGGTYKEIKQMLSSHDGECGPPGSDRQIVCELQWMMSRYNLIPKVWICCDRIPYESTDKNDLRITFDSKLRFQTEQPDLCYSGEGEYIIPDNMHIMEIKSSSGLPLWLCGILGKNGIYPHGFSKVGTAYENKILFQTVIQE